jgi:CBS domain-containing protein
MAKLARDVMTTDPACCTADMTLNQVARLMVENDCGEIPVVDGGEKPIGVITDRDIVSRVVAEDRNPVGLKVQEYMSQPAITVRGDTPIDEVLSTMEKHQIRRIPVTDESGRCAGIIAQADVATMGNGRAVSELVREVSRDTGVQSR